VYTYGINVSTDFWEFFERAIRTLIRASSAWLEHSGKAGIQESNEEGAMRPMNHRCVGMPRNSMEKQEGRPEPPFSLHLDL
jgi:hypothetical protein